MAGGDRCGQTMRVPDRPAHRDPRRHRNCINCKHTDCVEVCPVDCFHEGPNFLVIDPESCIDCTLCVAECPVGAIYPEDDVPGGQEHFLAINAELPPQWPVIDRKKPPLPDATQWAGVPDKRPEDRRLGKRCDRTWRTRQVEGT